MNCIFMMAVRALDNYFRSIILIITLSILLKNSENMSLNIPHNYFKKIIICLKHSRCQEYCRF